MTFRINVDSHQKKQRQFQSFEYSSLFAYNSCVYCTTRYNKCGRIRTKWLFFFTFIEECCVVTKKNIDKKLANRISYQIWYKRCLVGKFGGGSKSEKRGSYPPAVWTGAVQICGGTGVIIFFPSCLFLFILPICWYIWALKHIKHLLCSSVYTIFFYKAQIINSCILYLDNLNYYNNNFLTEWYRGIRERNLTLITFWNWS